MELGFFNLLALIFHITYFDNTLYPPPTSHKFPLLSYKLLNSCFFCLKKKTKRTKFRKHRVCFVWANTSEHEVCSGICIILHSITYIYVYLTNYNHMRGMNLSWENALTLDYKWSSFIFLDTLAAPCMVFISWSGS